MKVLVCVIQGPGHVVLHCESPSHVRSFTATEVGKFEHGGGRLGEIKRAACIVEHLRCASTDVDEDQRYIVDFDGQQPVAARRVFGPILASFSSGGKPV